MFRVDIEISLARCSAAKVTVNFEVPAAVLNVLCFGGCGARHFRD